MHGEHTADNEVRVSCVIVNYETSAYVERCVDSLNAQTFRDRLEIIVVDNPSPVCDIENLRDLQIDRLVDNPENVGYGLGCNAGVAVASPNSDFVCILNPDTLLGTPVVMEQWVAEFEELQRLQPNVGLLSPVLLNDNGTVQRSTYQFLNPLNYWLYHSLLAGVLKKFRKNVSLQESANPQRADVRTDWVMGAALLIPRPAWNANNGFSSAFFMYAEDQDFCLRLKACGYSVWVTSTVQLTHTQGEPSAENRDKGVVRFYDGLSVFINLHYGAVSRRTLQLCVIADMLIRIPLTSLLSLILWHHRLIMFNRTKGYCRVLKKYARDLLK